MKKFPHLSLILESSRWLSIVWENIGSDTFRTVGHRSLECISVSIPMNFCAKTYITEPNQRIASRERKKDQSYISSNFKISLKTYFLDCHFLTCSNHIYIFLFYLKCQMFYSKVPINVNVYVLMFVNRF